jgi:hypothetical protein
MNYQGRGEKARSMFDQNDMPLRERQIRNRIKKEGFWMRRSKGRWISESVFWICARSSSPPGIF